MRAAMGRPDAVTGEFVDVDGEATTSSASGREAPFSSSVISSADHWLFSLSSGGLTAGRVSPETALFPYFPSTGSRVQSAHRLQNDPARRPRGRQVRLGSRSTGNTMAASVPAAISKERARAQALLREINHDLALAFRYTWATSDPHGFVRRCGAANLRTSPLQSPGRWPAELLPRARRCSVQTNSSNRGRYKWRARRRALGWR